MPYLDMYVVGESGAVIGPSTLAIQRSQHFQKLSVADEGG